MPGLEANTESYNQPLPVSPLETVKNIAGIQQQKQQIESGAITIDKQKLDLMTQQFGVMNNELANLIDSGATKPQAAERLLKISKTLNLPPVATNHMMDELNQAPDVKTFAQYAIRRGMDTMQKYGVQLGTNETQTDNANTYQGVRASPEKGGGFTPGTQSAIQPGPGQPTINNERTLPTGQPNPKYLQPGVLGPTGPPGFTPALPVAGAPQPTIPVPRNRPVLPTTGPTGPTRELTAQIPTSFDNRFIPTGAPPGVASAIAAVGQKSGEDYAVDLSRAKNYQQDIYPMARVLDIVKEQGPTAFGPGTEGLNTLKSALVTWLPNVDKKTIDSVSDYEQAKKYLVQAARSSGATGTNDQLAAAFEANPNVKMSGATIENVVKSNIALRKMQHAQTLLFGQQNLPESEYSKWISKNQNVLDPRAFGFDIMSDEAKGKLLDSLASKDKSGNWIAKKGKEKEFQKFETSLSFANDAGLIEPPGRK